MVDTERILVALVQFWTLGYILTVSQDMYLRWSSWKVSYYWAVIGAVAPFCYEGTRLDEVAMIVILPYWSLRKYCWD